MAREFPHLKGATSFPSTTVKAYEQYRNNRNYNDYTDLTRLKVCSVPWTAETTDRVKWDTDAARNAFFDNLTGDVFEAETLMANIVDGQPIKLPIPWTSAQYANYLMVVPSDLPGTGNDLDNSDNRTNRVFYFIVATSYISPSVTECTLIRDDWTTFINRVRIPRIDLERGHQATMFTTPAEFLKNPLAHTLGLTDKESDTPNEPKQCAATHWNPLATGEPWVLMAIKLKFKRLAELKKAGDRITPTAATFTDVEGAGGAELQVNDYVWGTVSDMSNVTTPITTLTPGSGTMPTGHDVMAFPASQIDDVVTKIDRVYPQLWNIIGGCWIVPRTMFDVTTTTWSLDGITIQHVRMQATKQVAQLNFKQSDFAYDKHYANLTKLYTTPYAWLDIVNGDTGEHATVFFEDTSDNLAIGMRVSHAFPYLKAQTYLTGVNGNAEISYKWQAIDGEHTTLIPASAWHTLTTHEIPAYALYIDSTVKWALDNYTKANTNARANAIRAYQASELGANIGNVNAHASNATGLDNANASADTGNTNAANSAATGLTNTKITNSTVSSNAAADRQRNSDVVTRSNSMLTQNNRIQIATLRESTDAQNNRLGYDADADATMANDSYDALNTAAWSAAAGSAAATVATVGLTALSGGAASPALAAGMGAINSSATGVQTQITQTANAKVKTASIANMVAKVKNAQDLNDTIAANNIGTLESLANLQNTTNTEVVNINNALNKTVTDANVNTSNANATRTANTATANASRSATTAKNNAARTKNTGDANADRGRDTSTFANKTGLTTAQANYLAQVQDLNRTAALELTSANGDVTPDTFGLRGIQVRVMTQTPDVIRRCGDAFLRFGYTWHANVETPVLNLKKNFTFWQGTPTLIPENAPAQAISTIRELFETGVTIWREPDKIGSSIYDNEE